MSIYGTSYGARLNKACSIKKDLFLRELGLGTRKRRFHHTLYVRKKYLTTLQLPGFRKPRNQVWSVLQWLCILTSFQVLAAPESWSNYFFQPFSNLFVNLKPLSVISRLKTTKKRSKTNKTKHVLVYSSKLVDSLRGYLEIIFFGCFLTFLTFFIIFWLISLEEVWN